MRLIDADKLYLPYEEIASRMSVHYAPTVDAVPVVHAHWIKNSGDSYTVKCSNCKSERILADSWFEYCPKCGAKMDGDSSD